MSEAERLAEDLRRQFMNDETNFDTMIEASIELRRLSAIETQGVPDGYALVSKGALQMVVNVLQRDAANGMRVRGEIVEQLLASAPPAPQAKPQP